MTNRIEATGVGNARARTKRGAAVNLCSKKKKTYSSFAEPLALFTRLQIFER